MLMVYYHWLSVAAVVVVLELRCCSYVKDINQTSLPAPFYSVPMSISVCTALSTVFHFITLPTTIRFLTLYFGS